MGKVSFVEGIKQQFTTKTFTLIPVAVGINLIGGTLCSYLKLPLFLDSIGTLIVACLAGPWAAALAGFITNVFLAIVANPVYLPYSIVSILVGLTVGYLVKAGLLKSFLGIIVVWIACTIVNAISAASITFFVFGGATGATGTSLLTATLVVAMRDVLFAAFSSSLIENLIDKGIAVIIAVTIYKKIPKRFISQYTLGESQSDVEEVIE